MRMRILKDGHKKQEISCLSWILSPFSKANAEVIKSAIGRFSYFP